MKVTLSSGLFEKLSANGSFKWPILIGDKTECRRFTEVSSRAFILFDIHEGIVKKFIKFNPKHFK